MIHTDIDIKDGIYNWLKASTLASTVNGSIYKDQRPLNSEKEDIIISVLVRDAGSQIQEASVNVNIYIPDIRRGQEAIEDTVRLRTICTKAAEVMEYHHFGDGIYELESQSVFKANDIDWHIVNNSLSVRFCNE